MQVATAREAVLGHLGVGSGHGRHDPQLDQVTLLFTVVMTVVSVLAAASDRRGGRSQAAVGGRARDPRRLPVAGAVHDARRPSGGRRLPSGGGQPGRRADGAPNHRWRAGDRTRRHRRLYRDSMSFVAMMFYCAVPLRRRLGSAPSATATHRASLWVHVARAWAPIAALGVIAVLQNIDIIAAKHRFSSALASSYSGDGGRGEGPDLGGDGRRFLPGAGGLTTARRGRGHPSGARQVAGDCRCGARFRACSSSAWCRGS